MKRWMGILARVAAASTVLLAGSCRERAERSASQPTSIQGMQEVREGENRDRDGSAAVAKPDSERAGDGASAQTVDASVRERVAGAWERFAIELKKERTKVITDPNDLWLGFKIEPPWDRAAEEELTQLANSTSPDIGPLLIDHFRLESHAKLRAQLLYLMGQGRSDSVVPFLMRTVVEEPDERVAQVAIAALLWRAFRKLYPKKRGWPLSRLFQKEYMDEEGVFHPLRYWTSRHNFLLKAEEIRPEIMECLLQRLTPSTPVTIRVVVLSFVAGSRGHPRLQEALARLLPTAATSREDPERELILYDLWESGNDAMRELALQAGYVSPNKR